MDHSTVSTEILNRMEFSFMAYSKSLFLAVLLLLGLGGPLQASELNLAIPDLDEGKFTIFGQDISAWNLLFYGACVIAGTLGISLYLRRQIHRLPAHRSMLDVAE